MTAAREDTGSHQGWIDELVAACGDPGCPGPSEPEQDDDLRYYVCTRPECGYEWGHNRVRQPSSTGTCQLGVPEGVRSAFSQPAGQREPVMLQIGRRPE